MHRNDSLIIATCKRICAQNILGIVVANLQQALVFSLLGLFGIDALRNLDIELLVLTSGNKVYFTIAGFSDTNGISTATQFKVDNIFKTTCNRIIVIAEDTVSEGGIGQIEFLS